MPFAQALEPLTLIPIAASSQRVGNAEGLSEKQLRRCVKPLLTRKHDDSPIDFDHLDAEVFEIWLLTLRKTDGSMLSNSALNTHRAGFFNIYRDYGRQMRPVMESELKQCFKGLKRQLAISQARGEGHIKMRKDPLLFELYEFLSTHLMTLPGSDAILARVYLIISWNLMCRSANAFDIRHSPIEWRGDSLRVYIAHMTRVEIDHSIHVMCMPTRFNQLFALSWHWQFTGQQLYLMRDETSAPAISEHILCRRVLQHFVLLVLQLVRRLRQCIYAQVFKTPIPAMRLQEICTLEERMQVFHLVAILRGSGVSTIFQGIPEHLAFVGEFCLASLIYHIPFLRTHLRLCHPIIETALFQDANLLQHLSELVRCGFSTPDSKLKATGVPSHVSILSQMNELQDRTLLTIEKIEDARRDIVNDIVHELEDCAIGARTVTYDGLREALRNCLAEVGAHNLADQRNVLSRPDSPSRFCPPRVLSRSLVSGAEMPRSSCCLCACSKVLTCQNRNSQKRLSDARYLMKKIEAFATARDLLRSGQSVEETGRVYAACSSAVEVPLHTTHARKRRRG
ncbi:hypothetical protein PHMEG_0006839 [Phytophthora megakarya]|uniref:Uncharacterized protein n=1 Tax=Phytophthora megakarya TaxID=4795 RepID=A0A225WNU6_9STRA|nr:hypothetical protein PHMEG_0006839 [Phytophthora megakarya]